MGVILTIVPYVGLHAYYCILPRAWPYYLNNTDIYIYDPDLQAKLCVFLVRLYSLVLVNGTYTNS